MNKATMKIRFGGDSHQIDANTLINYLIHYQAVVDAANNVMGCGSKRLKVRINAIEKGSFVVDIELVESLLKTLFSSESVGYAASVCAVVGGVFGVYRKLKGAPVKDGQRESFSNSIQCGDGAFVNQIVNVYNSPVAREAISKSFSTVDADESVACVSVESDSGNVSFDRSEFKSLQYNNFDHENEEFEDREVFADARLVILSLGFEPGSRWNFSYNGVKISMNVKDDALMRQIDKGMRFGKGDAIRVKLKIVQKYMPEYMTYQDTSFRIVEFYEHCPAQLPLDMFK